MTPAHPRWPEFCERAFESKGKRQGKGGWSLKRILKEMGFNQFDCEMSLLYFIKRWILFNDSDEMDAV